MSIKTEKEIMEIKAFGMTHLDAISNSVCLLCGKKATSFHDEACEEEYVISGICQKCQDKMFG